MKTDEIIKEIKKLPIVKRIYIVEKAIHSIRSQQENNQIKNAVEEMYYKYKLDKELTIFTDLDFENFYETK